MSKMGKMLASCKVSLTPSKKFEPQDFVFKDGNFMVVLRPKDAELKLRSAQEVGKLPTDEQLDAFKLLISEQDHQFIGYACHQEPNILDKHGRSIDQLKPGDSLFYDDGKTFQPPAFMTTGSFHEERWGEVTVVVLPRPDLKSDSNTGIVVQVHSGDTPQASIVKRPGCPGDPDCDHKALNKIWTGDEEIDWRYYKPQK